MESTSILINTKMCFGTIVVLSILVVGTHSCLFKGKKQGWDFSIFQTSTITGDNSKMESRKVKELSGSSLATLKSLIVSWHMRVNGKMESHMVLESTSMKKIQNT